MYTHARVLYVQELLKSELQRVEDEISRVSSPGKAPVPAPRPGASVVSLRSEAEDSGARDKGARRQAPCMYACVCMYACMHACMYVCMGYVCMGYIHTHTHAHTHAHKDKGAGRQGASGRKEAWGPVTSGPHEPGDVQTRVMQVEFVLYRT
jgi:hypothetical protein